jgi:sigma-B regulation protein RsbU (phosphoserine phosphatase)
VTRTIPSYLRLHQAPVRDAASESPFSIDPVSRFWKAYTEATGWRLDRSHQPTDGVKPAAAKANKEAGIKETGNKEVNVNPLRLLPAFDGAMIGDADTQNESPAVTRDLAEQLALAASDLARRLEQIQAAYRTQEAELAVTSTPTGTPDQSGRLLERLERLLKHAAAATGCDAAGLYLLDNDTTTLKLRASYGLPADRIAVPARSLRGSRGDVESLVREVVLIDDLAGTLSTTWNSPEPYAAGIVTRIEEDDLPIGTLWLWSKEKRTFSEQEGDAARLAALGLAAELTRAALHRERAKWNVTSTSIKSATQWQMRQLPPAMELAPNIVVDGWTESPKPWACSWHAWDVLPDGSIAMAIAEASLKEMDGAMIAATARAAFAAHSNYRHTAMEMLRRISDSLWQTNTGDQLVSMLYLKLDPETGEGELASAGTIQSIVASRRGFRALTSGRECGPLASQIDCRPYQTEFRLHAGEAIIGINASVLDEVLGIGQSELASVAREALSRRNSPVLASIRRALARKPLEEERAGIILLRK